MNTDAIWTFITTQGADFGLKVIGAIIAWAIGRWLIGVAQRLVAKALERGKRMDATLSNYMVSILGVILNIVLILAILDMFGVRTTSFAALLAGAGLAIGTAWGGLLTHFAAGVFLQVTAEPAAPVAIPGRPYGFERVVAAQAAGDLAALRSRGRRAVHVHLRQGADTGLDSLANEVGAAVGAPPELARRERR